MTIRQVPPLNEKEWAQLVDELTKEPDPDRVAYIKRAVESGKKIKTHD